METVDACLRIIRQCQYEGQWLRFWALENPKGLLRKFLGRPVLTFQPYEFGEPWSKTTDLWGNFNTELRRNPVDPQEYETYGPDMSMWPVTMLPELPEGFQVPPDMSPRKSRRSMTPAGFAQAFYKANR